METDACSECGGTRRREWTEEGRWGPMVCKSPCPECVESVATLLLMRRAQGCDCRVSADQMRVGKQAYRMDGADAEWEPCRHGSSIREATPADVAAALIEQCRVDGEALPADCGNWCAYWSYEEGCKAYDCKAQDDAALLEAPETGGPDGS